MTSSAPTSPVADLTPAAPPSAAARQRGPGLSPSRANDFTQCPLLFRFRVIDKLPEPPSSAAVRGTLVHSVLERLYDAPLGQRTQELAFELLPNEWDKLLAASPEYGDLFGSESVESWLGGAGRLLSTYFTLENPNRLEPEAREMFVASQLADGPLLRGIIDRIDVAPDGAVRVVDYKSGKSPRKGYASSAEFQMRFYGLVVWRERGELPRMLQLIYLGDGQILRSEPTQAELEETESKIRAIWSAIIASATTNEWQTRRTPLCGWCAHQRVCPEFGGTPPVVDPAAVERATGIRPAS